MTRWAIVGGGLLGMTLAWRLARAGRSVVLFEAGADVGGLAGAWRIDDVVWDRHYHVTLLSDLHLRGLLAELGLESDMRWAQTRTGFFHDGGLHSLSNVWEFLTFPVLGLWDKVRLGATIVRAAQLRDGRRLESRTAEEWLTRWSGPRTVEKLWRPLLRSKLGDNTPIVSARFIWATIARLYQARASGTKGDMFGYVPGGYARILGRFAEQLTAAGVEIRTAHAVTRVEASAGDGVCVTRAGRSADTFDRVVLTVPPPVAATICPQLSDRERQQCAAVQYQGIICASLLLRRAFCGFYVLNLTDPTLPFTAVIEMTTLVDPSLLNGHHLIYLPRYVSQTDPLWSLDDSEIRTRFVAGLRKILPDFRDDDVVCFQISRVRHVFALPVVDGSSAIPPMQTSVPGLWLVTSAQIIDGTLNGNETVRLASTAVPRLLRAETKKATVEASDPEDWVRWWADRPHTDTALQERNAQWFVRAAEPLIGFRDDDVVLDIGCGQGFVAEALAGRVRAVHGVDVSLHQLDHARLRLGARAGIRFHELDPTHYTDLSAVSDCRFSLILCNSVVQYYPDIGALERLLEAVRRVAAPGARMLVTDLPAAGTLASDVVSVAQAHLRPRELGQSLRALIGYTVGGYATTRWRRGLLRVHRKELEQLLTRLGLEGRLLSDPLTPLADRLHLYVRFPGDVSAETIATLAARPNSRGSSSPEAASVVRT